MHTIQCNITLPASDMLINNSYVEPVLLQWVPTDDETGHLIISNYNEKVYKLVDS